jgi:hypothetical protein
MLEKTFIVLIYQNNQREVEADPHWQRSEDSTSYRPAPDRDKLGIMRTYAKKQLETLVNNIQHKRIQIGQPLDYAPLENYLGIIAEQLPHLNPNKQQTLLLKLALKGRKDYGPDIFTELMEVATDTLFATPTFPFQNRVLLLLQQERFKIVQAYHRVLQQLNIFSKLIGSTESTQAMNHTTRLIAEGFHLPHARAFRDEIPTPLFFERWFYRTFIGISSKSLWETLTLPALSEENEDETIEGYTLKRILDKVRHSRTTGLLSDDYLVSWAQAWIQKTETRATEVQKEAFTTFLDQRSAGDVEQETAIINFLTQAALVDMGILQFANS